MMFDWLVTGGVLAVNPASAVRGPKYVIKKGKTPVLTPDEARLLLNSIDVGDNSGLRDRALLAVMVYTFARVSAVAGMNVEDYYQQGKRWWVRLYEKGGKHHELPVHHKAEEYLDAYIKAAGIAGEKSTPLWRCLTKELDRKQTSLVGRCFGDRRWPVRIYSG
jgi:site-specific recombinase XerC